jgi:ParB/RepB/Spo0J family partition protein
MPDIPAALDRRKPQAAKPAAEVRSPKPTSTAITLEEPIDAENPTEAITEEFMPLGREREKMLNDWHKKRREWEKKIVEESHLPIDEVQAVGERRPIDEDAIRRLMESISSIGLQHPITVMVDESLTDPETDEVIGGWRVIAGAHRLEACRRLGHRTIPAVEWSCTDLEAELWEIAENLHRADLTKEQRDRQIRRYAELIKAQEGIPQNAEQLPKPRRGRPKSVTSKVAEATGLSDDIVRRALNPTPPKPKPPVIDSICVEVSEPDAEREDWNNGPPWPENEGELVARRRGFLWRASEAIRFARYDDLSGLEIDSEIIRTATETATAWNELLSQLRARNHN